MTGHMGNVADMNYESSGMYALTDETASGIARICQVKGLAGEGSLALAVLPLEHLPCLLPFFGADCSVVIEVEAVEVSESRLLHFGE